jgi:hypothetical protein
LPPVIFENNVQVSFGAERGFWNQKKVSTGAGDSNEITVKSDG